AERSDGAATAEKAPDVAERRDSGADGEHCEGDGDAPEQCRRLPVPAIVARLGDVAEPVGDRTTNRRQDERDGESDGELNEQSEHSLVSASYGTIEAAANAGTDEPPATGA